MTDLKRITDKIRKPLFWRRTVASSVTKDTPSTNTVGAVKQPRKWYSLSLVKLTALALSAVLFVPKAAHGQFGIDLAAILAALSKVESLLTTNVAAPIKTINQTQQSVGSYEKEVLYPITAINQAKSAVTQFESQFNQISNMYNVKVSSATLPQSQSLETLLLSRNTSNVPSISTQYQSVYGVVMAQNAASANVRNMTDMTDAQAEDAMKRAVAIDALADTELAQADKLGQQITTAAPGSAPILEAEADVWIVRANAYTQAALAELMRTRGIDIANQSKLAKLGATYNTNNNGLVNGALTTR